MTKHNIYTIAVLAMMIIGVGFVAPADIKISFTQEDVAYYTQNSTRLDSAISDSRMTRSERIFAKKLLGNMNNRLASKAHPDTAKVKK